jgi:hypothetical protein
MVIQHAKKSTPMTTVAEISYSDKSIAWAKPDPVLPLEDFVAGTFVRYVLAEPEMYARRVIGEKAALGVARAEPDPVLPFEQFVARTFVQYASAASETHVRRVLGEKAALRFLELKNIRPYWNFGKGEALTDDAERAFIRYPPRCEAPAVPEVAQRRRR